jgi:hypothetical protein
MEMVVMMVIMERPPPMPRRSGDDDSGDFPLTVGSDVAGFALPRSRR